MGRVLSIHSYELAEGVEPEALTSAFSEAEDLGLFQLPGLEEAKLLRGLRGERQGRWAALWIYSSQEAWEALWGPVGEPYGFDRYPPRWQRWERELLAPLLDRAPDTVTLTSYEEVDSVSRQSAVG